MQITCKSKQFHKIMLDFPKGNRPHFVGYVLSVRTNRKKKLFHHVLYPQHVFGKVLVP